MRSLNSLLIIYFLLWPLMSWIIFNYLDGSFFSQRKIREQPEISVVVYAVVFGVCWCVVLPETLLVSWIDLKRLGFKTWLNIGLGKEVALFSRTQVIPRKLVNTYPFPVTWTEVRARYELPY